VDDLKASLGQRGVSVKVSLWRLQKASLSCNQTIEMITLQRWTDRDAEAGRRLVVSL